jgi:hypothetical protein
MLGLNMSLKTTFKKTNVLLVVGVFFVSLSFVGHGGFGLASMVNGPLQIHQEGVTGRVLQLPLRSILDQFQEQLGIAYQAPKEELEERVSIDLQGESLGPVGLCVNDRSSRQGARNLCGEKNSNRSARRKGYHNREGPECGPTFQ